MGYEISVDHAEIHIMRENFGSVLDAIASIPHRMAWTELADIQRIAKSGDITEGITYDPASAGYALAAVASTLLKGEEIKPGLEMQNLGKADVDMDKRIIRFHKVLLVNKDNIDSLY